MVKRKYSIDDYAEFRTIKDWECKCCGKFPKEKATEEQMKHVGYKNLI